MEINRRGKADGIDAVEHAAVPLQKIAPIFDAVVAFDGGHHQAAQKTHDADGAADNRGLPKAEGR